MGCSFAKEAQKEETSNTPQLDGHATIPACNEAVELPLGYSSDTEAETEEMSDDSRMEQGVFVAACDEYCSHGKLYASCPL